VIPNRISEKLHSELLLALESARMRLSVAIAAESKSTPRDRWRYYLDTADRIGRFIRKLRHTDCGLLRDSQAWFQTLATLDRLPIQIRATRLCQILQDILAELE
jgi:hypothetical protein